MIQFSSNKIQSTALNSLLVYAASIQDCVITDTNSIVDMFAKYNIIVSADWLPNAHVYQPFVRTTAYKPRKADTNMLAENLQFLGIRYHDKCTKSRQQALEIAIWIAIVYMWCHCIAGTDYTKIVNMLTNGDDNIYQIALHLADVDDDEQCAKLNSRMFDGRRTFLIDLMSTFEQYSFIS